MPRIPVRSPMSNPPRKPPADADVFFIFLMTLPWSLAAVICLILANFGEALDSSGNRQIILDVPESSRVNAQVTSENNSINLPNL